MPQNNNKKIARIFREIAGMLSILGDNPFRIRAYEKAALNIENLTEDVSTLIGKGTLTSIPGIGKDLQEKIKSFLETGKIEQHEELKSRVPEGVLEIMNIPSIGPKTAKLLFEKLKIDSIDKLEKYALQDKLTGLEGIKEKTIENILKGINLIKKSKERMPLFKAIEVAEIFVGYLKKAKGIKKIEVGGSVRRRKETIGDIDILAVAHNPGKIIDAFVKVPEVKDILAHGLTKSSILTSDNIQIDLRVVEEKSFGAALVYFTGSKSFNIKLRAIAQKSGYKINEYGIFSAESGKYICGRTEEEIFDFLNMQYIPPPLREDRGEIELALKGKLPSFITFNDIKGDFHIHSTYSDGQYSIEEIALYAKKLGYKYIAIADHSRSLKVASGVSIKNLYKKIREIRELNKKLSNFRILCSAEVDILQDGKLDYPDETLKKLDIIIAAVHTGFKQPKEKITARIKKAVQNKYVDIIAHPTGKLWGVRDAYQVDIEEIIKTCRRHHTALEINCFPQRMDLNDTYAFSARKNSVLLALGTDAHMLDQMQFMKFGVDIALRAWCVKKDILNAWPLTNILKWKRNKLNTKT